MIAVSDTRRPHNGDGFGVGYYTDRKLGPEPCIFTSTIPAWNCINLERLASKTTSSLIFAHVRATTEGTLSDSNCHPFRHGGLMWMHNGNIGAWQYIKRALVDSIEDRWFLGVQGGTDSEWAFALFLDSMAKIGHDPSADIADGGFGHSVLRTAMLRTIERINRLIADIPERHRAASELDTRSLLNFAVTDGFSVVCTRYVSSRTDEAASLYFSSGTNWREHEPRGNYKMERLDKGADIVLVASEPLTFERDNWVTVPTNSILTIHKQTVMIHPIVDEYYNASPSYTRSSGFAVSKGLVSTGPGAAVAPAAAAGESLSNGVDPPAAVNGVRGGVAREKLEEAQQRLAGLEVGVM
ncbi:MAG: hypothetical protein M1832_004249 [Thelocarpon impressellum]|nr:MAG: hypothetical protein M1832_004249 [Thelocarpon impressellum]